jgi:copper chaperone
MEKQTFEIPNISCSHCTKTIKNELEEMEGVSNVQADVGSKTVTVQWQEPASRDKILAILQEINYPAAS